MSKVIVISILSGVGFLILLTIVLLATSLRKLNSNERKFKIKNTIFE